jgi:hypothetical protein
MASSCIEELWDSLGTLSIAEESNKWNHRTFENNKLLIHTRL